MPVTSSETKSTCRGKRPKAPFGASATSLAACTSSAARVGVTILSRIVLRLPGQFVHVADHVEIALGPVAELVAQNALAGCQRLLQRHQLAGLAGELFGGEEGLGQEPFQPPGALHGGAV